jgi:hypothetical protein
MNKQSGFTALAVIAVGMGPALPAAAATYDGGAAMVCEIAAVHECAPGTLCQVRTVESVNFAPRLRIDVSGKRIQNLEQAKEKSKESPIQSVAHQSGKLVLTGAEYARGWVIVVHEDSGRLSGAASGDGDSFAMFGQCKTQ